MTEFAPWPKTPRLFRDMIVTEGVIVYHTASGKVFKALIENDDQPKGEG